MHEGHRERLRQTFLEHGASTLHEHQLLELLLTYAIPRRDTNPLAHSLLAAYGSLDKVLAANPYDLMRQEGIGRQAAVLLALAGALMQRGGAARPEKAALNTPEAASRYCMALLAGAKYEETYVISLDKRRAVLHADKVASGTLGETVLYPRLVLECAQPSLRKPAAFERGCKNHPFGIRRAANGQHNAARSHHRRGWLHLQHGARRSASLRRSAGGAQADRGRGEIGFLPGGIYFSQKGRILL